GVWAVWGAGVTAAGRAGVDSLGVGRRSGVSSSLGRGVRGSSDFGRGVRDGGSSSGSGVGLGLDFFLGGCWAGFGFVRGVAADYGGGVGTVRFFSRALRKSCFFSSSVSSARVILPANPATRSRAQSARCQRKLIGGRLTAREIS